MVSLFIFKFLFKFVSSPLIISDTLVKLMEYGDDDDDFEENTEEPLGRNQGPAAAAAARKPFWAL